MEVFIRDEETKWDISYSLADSNNSLDCKDHKPIIVKSLDQHDAEVRADERKKVCEELEEWVKKYQIFVGDYVYITALNLNAKLYKMKAELEKTPQGKGEKDE